MSISHLLQNSAHLETRTSNGRRPQNLKVEYISNHWSDPTQMLNLTFGYLNEVYSTLTTMAGVSLRTPVHIFIRGMTIYVNSEKSKKKK